MGEYKFTLSESTQELEQLSTLIDDIDGQKVQVTILIHGFRIAGVQGTLVKSVRKRQGGSFIVHGNNADITFDFNHVQNIKVLSTKVFSFKTLGGVEYLIER